MNKTVPSLPNRLLDLVDDHIELAELETRYELKKGHKRLEALLAVGLGIAATFVLVLVSLLDALMRAGVPIYASGLILALLVGGASYAIYHHHGQRDAEAGEAFSGSRQELRRTLQWIRQHLS